MQGSDPTALDIRTTVSRGKLVRIRLDVSRTSAVQPFKPRPADVGRLQGKGWLKSFVKS